MTTIRLHPRNVPRGLSGPHLLVPPWRWWRTRLRDCPDGSLFHQQVDDPINMREYSIMFNLLEVNEEIEDPPAMYLIEEMPEYEDYSFSRGRDRVIMTRGPTAYCDVVWHERPGERWDELPGTTCEPGQYRLESTDRDRPETESTTQRITQYMPLLRWPVPGRSSQGMFDAFAQAAQSVRDGFDAFAQNALSARDGFVRAWRTNEQLSVAAAFEQNSDMDAVLQAIYSARRHFEMDRRVSPAAVMMNPEDYLRLNTQALQGQGLREQGLFTSAAGSGSFATIMGLQILIEHNLPPGRILVVGQDGLERQYPDRRAIEEIAASTGIPAALLGTGRDDFLPLEDGDLLAPARSNVLPEQDLVDEIDRLVNEQVATGPVDDYRIDRYPKCTHCHHDWHGLLCDACTCLGELEEPV